MIRVHGVLVLMVAALALAGCTSRESGDAAPATSSTTTAGPTATAAPSSSAKATAPPTTGTSGAVIGPDGWGSLRLGMDAAAARATGLFVESPPPEGEACVSWTTARATPVDAVISPTLGVAALLLKEGAVAARTPEGIGIGSTAAEVHTAYPSFDVADVDAPNGPLVEVPGNADAAYRLQFDDAGVVQTITLELANQNCYA